MLNKLALLRVTVRTWFTARLSVDDVGASLVEYALLLALIAVVAITALVFLGHSVNNTLQNVGKTSQVRSGRLSRGSVNVLVSAGAGAEPWVGIRPMARLRGAARTEADPHD